MEKKSAKIMNNRQNYQIIFNPWIRPTRETIKKKLALHSTIKLVLKSMQRNAQVFTALQLENVWFRVNFLWDIFCVDLALETNLIAIKINVKPIIFEIFEKIRFS